MTRRVENCTFENAKAETQCNVELIPFDGPNVVVGDVVAGGRSPWCDCECSAARKQIVDRDLLQRVGHSQAPAPIDPAVERVSEMLSIPPQRGDPITARNRQTSLVLNGQDETNVR